MTATFDLIAGLAQLLEDAGLVTYRSDGTNYTPTETGVGYKYMPELPNRFVTLTPYGANNDQPVTTLGNQPVQVKMRGTADPQDVDDLGDGIFQALHGVTDRMFGSVHVVQILRVSSIPLGMEEQARRWLRSDNYSIDVDLPGTPLRPA
jgi:hypothetical protein